MQQCKFSEIVDVAKFSSCKTCSTYVYTIPCSLDSDFEIFMKPLGGTKYPLNQISLIRMETDFIKVASRIGINWLDVKYKTEEAKYRPLFETQLASYVGVKNNLVVIL